MKHVIAIAQLSTLLACGGGSTALVTEPVTLPPPESVAAPLQAVEPQTSSRAITLAPGFAPPYVVEGRAGGISQAEERDASHFGDGCIGTIGATPNHVLTLTDDISYLRIYARSNEDITLVVRKPDGTYICNDDTEGLNPLVTMPSFAAGEYAVWVGTYSTEESGAIYTLGFSTDPTAMPSSL